MGDVKAGEVPRENRLEERPSLEYGETGIDLRKYWKILRPSWWKIALFSFAVGTLTFILMLRMPNIYQATAVITPAIDERRQNPTMGLLATFGIDVGGPARVEDLESLFRSNDLAVRVFRKYNLWPILLGDRYDPATGGIKVSGAGRLFGVGKKQKPIGDWDAIRTAKGSMQVSVNRKANTVSISFESPSPEGSANIVKYLLDEGKNHLQEEALDRAIKNKKFIEEQIGKTIDALTRDRLYSLYGQEVEREMMARNREQFGFRVIDSPRVPDRISKPQRARSAVTATILSFLVACIFFAFQKKHPR